MDTPIFSNQNDEYIREVFNMYRSSESFNIGTVSGITPGNNTIINVDGNGLTFRKPRKQSKCYSARRGLKKFGELWYLKDMVKKFYNGCLHCAWYSYHFPRYTKDEDFEKLKVQFVRHMNRSHPDICKKKLMKRLNNK